MSFTLGLLKTKEKNKWSDTSLDEHLKFLQGNFPEGNVYPTSIEDAKKNVCPLDFPYIRYHACVNDYIIYRNENAEKTSCSKCNASRYKKDGKTKTPQKVVWYFPLTPRLQRYFVDHKEAELMRWHKDRKKPDDGDNPWKCMKTKYIHMSMLIQGPKQSGNDINLYLQLLKEELHTLWTAGVRTWDASAGDYFDMRAR